MSAECVLVSEFRAAAVVFGQSGCMLWPCEVALNRRHLALTQADTCFARRESRSLVLELTA